MATRPNQPCPCNSGKKYKQCCRMLHHGAPAPDAEALMRSRYAAYALGEVEYIVATTHPDGPQHQEDGAAWRASVRAFCEATAFEGLEVLESGALDDDEAFVTFRARLTQSGRDVSFTERSTFRRREGRWAYHSGTPRPS